MPKRKEDPAPQKPEQPYLFGDADMILNALDLEQKEWRERLEKIYKADKRLEEKREEAVDRIYSLEQAIQAVRDHAPKTEDPSPPGVKQETLKSMFEETEVIDEEKAEDLLGLKEEAEEDEQEENEEEAEILIRHPRGPLVPELIKEGDPVIFKSSDEPTVPFTIVKVEGPYYRARVQIEEDQSPKEIETPAYFRIYLANVDAPRTKSGKLRKDYEPEVIHYMIGFDGRILSLFQVSDDEIVLNKPKEEKHDHPAEETETGIEEDAPEEEVEDEGEEEGMF